MEGDSNWKTKNQGRHLLASNANDWRSTHESDQRKMIIFAIVEKLKICFPKHSQNDISNTACKFEGKIYGMATDKSDYLRKISEKIMIFDKKFRSVQSSYSINETITPVPAAQGLNQGKSLPTSFPYTHTPIRQQRFYQNNIHECSGFSTHVTLTISAAQRLNIQMGEGVHSDIISGSQRQTQGRQFTHQTSLSTKQPVQQQFTHQTSLSTIHQPFPQSSSLFSLTSSGQQNSQFLPRHQFPSQRVHSSYQQQMYVPSQEQKQKEHEQLINQLMNGQDVQQNHLTSQQNNWDQQGAFTVSSSQQNNIASFQEMAQQNNNLHNMHLQQHIYSHSNNSPALPSQQQQYMHGGQSGNFNVYESSLLGTQAQEVGQSQPVRLQQYQPQQPQSRIFQQHLNDTQRFQAAASQDCTCKTPNANGWDWKEETYHKIKALKEKYLLVLSTLLQKLSDKLGEVDSLPQQKMQHEPIQKLRVDKSTLELVIEFLNVRRNSISESHRDRFSMYEEQVLRFTKNHQTMSLRPMQHQQFPSCHNQHSNISPAQSSVFHQKQFHHLQMQHQLLQSQQQQQPQTNRQKPQIQNYSSLQLLDQHILPTIFHNTGTSSMSLGSPFVDPSPSLGDLENPIYVDSPVSHGYQLQAAPQEQPFDRLIKAFQSSPESLTQSVTEMSSVICLADRLVDYVHSIGGSRASLAEDLSARALFRLQQEESKRHKRSFTTLPLDIASQTDSYKQFCSLESEANSTASSGSKAHKIEPGCALLQEIKDINGSLVETVVNKCNEEFYPSEVTSGTIVTCTYSPLDLSDTLEAHYKSGHIKYDDLSARTRSRFSLSMKEFSEPMSLKEIAQFWDVCARETMAEYAERHGGGTFSTKYGHWEPVPGTS